MQRMLTGVLLALLLGVATPLAVQAGGEPAGMAWRELTIGRTITVDATTECIEQSVELKAGECLRVELLAAAGTGYQWELSGESGKLALVHQATSSAAMEPQMPGALMRSIFILQAPEEMNGEETVIFVLRRPWEQPTKNARSAKFNITVR